MLPLRALLIGLPLLGFASACRSAPPPASDAAEPSRPEPAARPTPASTVGERSASPPVAAEAPPVDLAPPPEPPEPPRVEHIRVPGDRPASIVRAKDGAAPRVVFLHGMCSNGAAYLHRFPVAASAHGGVVALEGDVPCQGTDYRSFSWDAARQHARIEAALAAAGRVAIPAAGIVLVGYSQGAAIGEQLVSRWPERYARVVLIGAPSDPSTAKLGRARGVVTMSCSRDVVSRMKDGAARIRRAGVPATYLEMPGCTHGDVADAERVFGEAFDWLDDNARLPAGDAAAVPLVGAVDAAG
jgi:pimeloyl-ACP methyl ester carboxylesterase